MRSTQKVFRSVNTSKYNMKLLVYWKQTFPSFEKMRKDYETTLIFAVIMYVGNNMILYRFTGIILFAIISDLI